MAPATGETQGDPSVGRQGGVGHGDTHPRGADDARLGLEPAGPGVGDLLAVQVRLAARRFLRVRPWIVLPAALANGVLLARSGAPAAQLAVLGPGLGLTLVAFAVESVALGRRELSARWLRVSLGATLVALALGCAVSGGASSPIVPLLFAPLITAFAAFGRSTESRVALGFTVLALLALALGGAALPFARPPEPAARWMTVASTVASMALLLIAVAGLADAYRRTAIALDRLRAHAIEEALDRARRVESIGAVVAHEVKNPLTAIKGLIQLASRTPGSERDARRFEVVLAEVDRVEATLREYLSFARPLQELRVERVDLRRLLDDLAVALEGRAAAAAVTIAVEGEAAVEGDPRRLREAILNLASNAVEAMRGRGGRLALGCRPVADGARVVVADTGPGMAAEPPPFTTDKESGTGLGLAIARRAVVQHGGTLAIDSSAGGTTITVTLPARPGAPLEEMSPATTEPAR